MCRAALRPLPHCEGWPLGKVTGLQGQLLGGADSTHHWELMAGEGRWLGSQGHSFGVCQNHRHSAEAEHGSPAQEMGPGIPGTFRMTV